MLVIVPLLLLSCGIDRERLPYDTAMEGGWYYFRLHEFGPALRSFQAVIDGTDDPADPERLEALFGQGLCWGFRRPGFDLRRARGLFDTIRETAPDSDWAAWSALETARMVHLAPEGLGFDARTVQEAYGQVYEHFPEHPAGQEAFINQHALRLLARDRAEAEDVLETMHRFIEFHPDSPFLSQAWSVIVNCHEILRQPAKALAADLRALVNTEEDPDSVVDLSFMYWRIAVRAEFEAGDFETARRYYRKLREEYPRDQRCFAAQLALNRMDEKEARVREELRAARGATGGGQAP